MIMVYIVQLMSTREYTHKKPGATLPFVQNSYSHFQAKSAQIKDVSYTDISENKTKRILKQLKHLRGKILIFVMTFQYIICEEFRQSGTLQ